MSYSENKVSRILNTDYIGPVVPIEVTTDGSGLRKVNTILCGRENHNVLFVILDYIRYMRGKIEGEDVTVDTQEITKLAYYIRNLPDKWLEGPLLEMQYAVTKAATGENFTTIMPRAFVNTLRKGLSDLAVKYYSCLKPTLAISYLYTGGVGHQITYNPLVESCLPEACDNATMSLLHSLKGDNAKQVYDADNAMKAREREKMPEGTLSDLVLNQYTGDANLRGVFLNAKNCDRILRLYNPILLTLPIQKWQYVTGSTRQRTAIIVINADAKQLSEMRPLFTLAKSQGLFKVMDHYIVPYSGDVMSTTPRPVKPVRAQGHRTLNDKIDLEYEDILLGRVKTPKGESICDYDSDVVVGLLRLRSKIRPILTDDDLNRMSPRERGTLYDEALEAGKKISRKDARVWYGGALLTGVLEKAADDGDKDIFMSDVVSDWDEYAGQPLLQASEVIDIKDVKMTDYLWVTGLLADQHAFEVESVSHAEILIRLTDDSTKLVKTRFIAGCKQTFIAAQIGILKTEVEPGDIFFRRFNVFLLTDKVGTCDTDLFIETYRQNVVNPSADVIDELQKLEAASKDYRILFAGNPVYMLKGEEDTSNPNIETALKLVTYRRLFFNIMEILQCVAENLQRYYSDRDVIGAIRAKSPKFADHLNVYGVNSFVSGLGVPDTKSKLLYWWLYSVQVAIPQLLRTGVTAFDVTQVSKINEDVLINQYFDELRRALT